MSNTPRMTKQRWDEEVAIVHFSASDYGITCSIWNSGE